MQVVMEIVGAVVLLGIFAFGVYSLLKRAEAEIKPIEQKLEASLEKAFKHE